VRGENTQQFDAGVTGSANDTYLDHVWSLRKKAKKYAVADERRTRAWHAGKRSILAGEYFPLISSGRNFRHTTRRCANRQTPHAKAQRQRRKQKAAGTHADGFP
jgi:hypothetical protein